MRFLPHDILDPSWSSRPTLEALRIREKYSHPDADIGENELDYVAILYMNTAATLFWLPNQIRYLTTCAPKDSYHFEVMLLRLSDPKFSNPLITAASTEEKRLVLEFLSWLETNTNFLTGSELRRCDFDRATEMWGATRS